MGARHVFGIGTGRCGTQSLSVLLQEQGAAVSHAMGHCAPGKGYPGLANELPWDGVDNGVFREAMFRIDSRRGEVVGDVGPFWLEYVPLILDAYPEARIICLRRNQQQCVASLLEMQTGLGRNDFSEDPGEDTRTTRLTPKFPLDREAATARYWAWYYEQAELMARAFPGQVKVVQMEHVLNSSQGQESMLVWAGFNSGSLVLIPGLKHNTMEKIREHRARKAAGQ